MSRAETRPDDEATLTGFEWVGGQEPEPAPATDYDGLQAVAAAVAPGWSATQDREDRNNDRVVTAATCSVCGQVHADAGVCPVREANGELADDRVRTVGGGD